MESCVFCGIVREVAPASLVYSDEKVVAFMDEQRAQIFKVAMRVSVGLRRSGARCEGVNLLLTDRETVSQEVSSINQRGI